MQQYGQPQQYSYPYGAQPYYIPQDGYPTQAPQGWQAQPQYNAVPFPNAVAPSASYHATSPAPLGRPSYIRNKPTNTRNAVPSKSALKRRNAAVIPERERSRSRNSNNTDRQRTYSLTRQRTNSTGYQSSSSTCTLILCFEGLQRLPEHLFVSFEGNNELRLDNLAFPATLDDFREFVLPVWPQGVQSSRGSRDNSWRVAFNGQPWSSSGPEAILVHRMLCNLFTTLAKEGYQFYTLINSGHRKSPQLAFFDTEQEITSHYFSIALSHSGYKVTIYDAPESIKESIAVAIRGAFHRHLASDTTTDEQCVIRLSKSAGGQKLNKNKLAAYIMDHINFHGYQLEASIPLGKGPLGFGSKREVWILKRIS
ncbi:hypothetical protein JAAARDRAFT_119354 [Jaapia argillacea MUCL 33604]|uniref:Uncharacterized protein n=1 Tax=Jaapia argillacea MUCL 33604 TaxID=933084 RepID=A0A067QLP8_9AGAM|nr:hypothetical protein JAAARDRAFT_119354 [Jaapia argillacea MUCL 33604]